MASLLSALPAPRTAGAPDEDLPAALLALADADADALGDALHDGALQALVVARYAADLAVRGGDAALARDAVQEALVALRRAVWQLRPRGEHGLLTALRDLAAHRAATGAAPLHLDLDDEADCVDPRAASVAYRLVQRCCGEAAVGVRVARTPDGVRVELDAAPPDPAGAAARARAVGAALDVHPAGAVLRLPVTRPLTEEAP